VLVPKCRAEDLFARTLETCLLIKLPYRDAINASVARRIAAGNASQAAITRCRSASSDAMQ
jgi:hypothetical protein